MIYEIKKNLHNDFSIFELNKCLPRAYAIPFHDEELLKKTPLSDERYSSDAVTCLSGKWDFKFYDSITRLPDKLNTLKTKFTEISVPSDWQRTGFQEPVYLNCPYEFKTFEPDVPEDMPVGVYRKFFEIEDPEKTRIISFLGVANNLSLYLNGTFVGYSEGTHNTAEFDITNLVRPGRNELVAVLFKWCNGSFLESQDMFRENGIFRDVLLYEYDGAYLYDYHVKTAKAEGGYSLCVETTILPDTADCVIKGVLCTRDGKEIAKKEAPAAEGALDFGIQNVTEWNPEQPVTYDLYITLINGKSSSTIRSVTGFRTIEIKGSVFTFNDRPIKMLGVNHHDSNLHNGYVMSFEDLEKDIRLMKSLNVNAVRTSHYPPDPVFLTLADLYGLYVVDEADIETHGCGEMADDICYISKQAKWVSHYVDRVKRMYFRDRNHPCVTMWSLGNESGGYKCQDACRDFLKAEGTTIPVHYEGVVHSSRFHYDVVSEMYTSTEDIELMMQGKRKRIFNGKPSLSKDYNAYPFYLCEYAHAMGVGPGNLKEYVDLFLKWDTSMGGCIWEWCDHTVYHPPGDKKYKYKYTYGGDHGEKQHDGHFCVDGLMYSDRRLHTGAKEMKVAYRPLRAEYLGKQVFRFTNIRRFASSDDIDVTWVKLVNGEETARGELGITIEPMKSLDVTLNLGKTDPAKDCHVNFIYTDKNDGSEIAVEQVTLNDVPIEYDIPIDESISVSVDHGNYTVSFINGKAVFNNAGELVCYEILGKNFLSEKAPAFAPNLYRALIDNDSANRERWIQAGLNKLKQIPESVFVELEEFGVHITSVFALKAGRKKLYTFMIGYTVSALGAMEITADLVRASDDAPADIPRFGLTLGLSRSFENVVYYGRGEAENMPDFNIHAPVGIYASKVCEMHEPYVYPQENGMHCDVKKIELSGKDGKLTVYADEKLAFSAHHYTQDALDRAAHQEDLTDMGLTYLTLDGFVRGIGSSSCGPDTRAEYRLHADNVLSFSFTIIPE